MMSQGGLNFVIMVLGHELGEVRQELLDACLFAKLDVSWWLRVATGANFGTLLGCCSGT